MCNCVKSARTPSRLSSRPTQSRSIIRGRQSIHKQLVSTQRKKEHD